MWFLVLDNSFAQLYVYGECQIPTAAENTKNNNNNKMANTKKFIWYIYVYLGVLLSYTQTQTIHNGFAYAIPINVT